MKVNRQALIDSLEKASLALGGATAPVDQKCFRFYKDQVQATNGILLITAKLPEGMDLTCKVPGDSLLGLLKTITGEQVELVMKGDDLRVVTNRIVGKFQTVPMLEKDFKAVKIDPKTAQSIGGKLRACLAMGRHNVLKTGTGPMCGVRIEGGVMFATNKFSILRVEHSEGDTIHCTVPVEFIDALAKFEAVDGVIFTGEALVAHLGTDQTNEALMASTVIGGDYPNLDQYFKCDYASAKTIELAEPLTGTVNRCVAFLKDVENVDKDITVTCGKQLTIKAKSPAVGEFEETLDLVKPLDSQVEFLINPLMLKSVTGNKFMFLPKEKLVLFADAEIGSQYLVQTRE
jgi:hypothetical protein